MSKKITVLGAGLVGSAIAKDLAVVHDVTVVDSNPSALSTFQGTRARAIHGDVVAEGSLEKLVADCDLVVGALPGHMGFEAARRVINSGKNMVDISFFAEDPFELDALAQQRNVTIVTDCGVAPGMGNIILGFHNERMQVTRYHCMVGGLPLERDWPWEYKAVFSPIDVIEEYVRPARFVMDGHEVVREALSDPELHHFDGIGTLESWNSDGLRSLIKTMPHIPDMIERTLRYPGTIEYLRVLRESGFFSKEPVDIHGTLVRPVDLTARLLFPMWKLMPHQEDFTVMRIRIEGVEEGKNKAYIYDLLDRRDRVNGTISMARTTGFTCAAVAHLVLDGKFARKGICPPEYVGAESGCYEFVNSYLAERNVIYKNMAVVN